MPIIDQEEIKPHVIYTTEEARGFLKVSDSTIKRLLKGGVIRAYKVGGQYRIWGAEILRLVSPDVEDRVYHTYRRFKNKAKRILEKW